MLRAPTSEPADKHTVRNKSSSPTRFQDLHRPVPIHSQRVGSARFAARSVGLRPSQGGLVQRKCTCGGTPGPTGECAECRRKRLVGCQAIGHADPSMVPPIVNKVLHSPGQPLDSATRDFMEPRFGHDFSHVRVHADGKAAESAHLVNALAYTVGQNVVFGAGRYAPETVSGKKLLTHELTHVVQQTRASSGTSAATEGSLESEADSAARTLIHERSPILVAGASPPRIARQTEEVNPSGLPKSVPARFQYEETPLPGGRVRIRAWGTVGDPITRPGLEKKYPLPKDVGLPNYDRWHLAGPDATGAEAGIAYAPENFNVGKTAQIENVVRNARAAVREQGGDVYFDFTAECRVVGEHEGVQIRRLERVAWRVEARLAGSDKITPVLNETASPAIVGPVPPGQTRVPPSDAASSASISQAPSEKTPAPTAAPPRAAPAPGAEEAAAPIVSPSEGASPTSSTPQGGPAPRPAVVQQRQPTRPPAGARVARTVRSIGGALVTLGALLIWNYLMSKFEKSIEEHFTQPIIEEKLKVLKPTIDAQLNEQIGVMADLQLRQPGKPLYANISTLTTLYRVGEEEELAGLTVELISVDISAVKIEHSEASRIWVGSYLLARAPRDLTRTTYSVELEPLSKEQLRDILEEQIAREELGEANTSSTPEAQVAANRRRNELVTQLQQLDSP